MKTAKRKIPAPIDAIKAMVRNLTRSEQLRVAALLSASATLIRANKL